VVPSFSYPSSLLDHIQKGLVLHQPFVSSILSSVNYSASKRAMLAVISSFAAAASAQPSIFTHLPSSRSL
jgi:hypothetical protein